MKGETREEEEEEEKLAQKGEGIGGREGERV